MCCSRGLIFQDLAQDRLGEGDVISNHRNRSRGWSEILAFESDDGDETGCHDQGAGVLLGGGSYADALQRT